MVVCYLWTYGARGCSGRFSTVLSKCVLNIFLHSQLSEIRKQPVCHGLSSSLNVVWRGSSAGYLQFQKGALCKVMHFCGQNDLWSPSDIDWVTLLRPAFSNDSATRLHVGCCAKSISTHTHTHTSSLSLSRSRSRSLSLSLSLPLPSLSLPSLPPPANLPKQYLCLSVCLSVCLPACLPAWLAGWLAGWLSVCLSLSLCLFLAVLQSTFAWIVPLIISASCRAPVPPRGHMKKLGCFLSCLVVATESFVGLAMCLQSRPACLTCMPNLCQRNSPMFTSWPFFPTSLCGVLVFRLAPAAPLPLPLPRPPAAVSLTHHTSLITALLITPHSSQHHSSHLHHFSTSHHTSLITALLVTPHSSQHYSSHLTHHSTTHHTSLITALLITPLVNHTTLSHHSTTHHTTCAAGFRVAGALHRAFWRSCRARGRRLGRAWLSCGRRSTQSLLEELRRAWPPLGPRLAFVWQAQYTEPPEGAAARVAAAWPRLAFVWQAQYTEPRGGAATRVAAAWAAAGFRVAGAVHRASWRSCGACGRRLGRGWLSCGRCSTQSLLKELRRAWPPLGPRLAFVWQAQYTEPSGGAVARVAAAWAAAGFRVAGAVHRAFWRSCGAHGRRLGRGWLSCGSTQSLLSDTTLSPTTLWHTIFHTTLSHHFVTHHLSHIIFHTTLSHTLFHTPSLTHHLLHTIFHTPSLTHHLWHTIFYTPSLSHHFVTHHLSHIILHTTLSHTIFHIPSLTPHLWHAIFHTPSQAIFHSPSFTHHFVTHHVWHTIFHTQLCPTPSFTHSHHTIFGTHHVSPHHLWHTHTALSHTIFPPPPPLSFLPSPSPLQHFLLIIGRSWLVGLSGPFIWYVLIPSWELKKNETQKEGGHLDESDEHENSIKFLWHWAIYIYNFYTYIYNIYNIYI